MEVQLRPVERAVALVDNEVLAHAGDGLLQNLLVGLPLLHGADVVFGHGGQLYGVFQAKHVVHLVEQADNVLDLALHLFPGHEDVGIVLGKAPDAEQSVERAGQLMAMHQTQFAHPQGQIAVGMGLTGVDQHTAGAVHGLDGVILAVDDGGVHIVLVMIPVAGLLPQLTVQDHGGGDLHIAVALVDFPPVVDQGVAQHHALGQEEGEAGAVVGEHEQSQLLAETAVVTLLGLFDALKVSLQLFLALEGNAVDSLEHLPVAVAPPVSAAGIEQLEAVVLDPAGVIQMGACAQVGEIALRIEGNDRVLGQVVDQLHLVGLIALLHIGNGLGAGLLAADDGQTLLADLLHLRLDLGKMLGREGEGRVKVIVPALVNGGADGQLHLRPQALDGLRHDVGAGVPVGLAILRVFKGELVFHNKIPPFRRVLSALYCVGKG